MASRDRQRLQRLLPYLGRDRRRLILTLVLLLPVALAAAVQPLLVGQAIAVLRREPTMPWLAGLAVPQALQLLVLLLLCAVLLRLGLQGIQTFKEPFSATGEFAGDAAVGGQVGGPAVGAAGLDRHAHAAAAETQIEQLGHG